MFNFNEVPMPEALDARIAELLVELQNLNGESEQYTTTAKNLATLMGLRNDALKTANESTRLQIENLKVETTASLEKEKIETNAALDREKILIDGIRNDLESRKIEIETEKIELDKEKFASEREDVRSWKPTPDAVVGAVASVAGILFVLHYEKLGVITSKALGFVGKTLK